MWRDEHSFRMAARHSGVPWMRPTIYLADALRLYERIDDQLGAGG